MKVKYSKSYYKFLKGVATVVLWPLTRTKYTNKNNIPKEGRFIITPNHISGIDPILVGIGQKRPLRFMAKAELFESSFMRWFYTKLGAFPVDRGKGDKTAIENAKKMIDDGDALGIFIEGTRSKTGELLRPKSGAVMIAHQMNCSIIPASVTYKGTKKRMFSKIYVTFGDPVTTKDLGIENGSPREYREASRILMEKIRVMWERDKYGNKTG